MKAKEKIIKQKAVINSILKMLGASSLGNIFRLSSQLFRKWKELFGKKRFHKQTGLYNNLTHPTAFTAKYIAILCSVSYFAIICLSSETVPYNLSHILTGIAVVLSRLSSFLAWNIILSWLTSSCSCYCFRLGVSGYHLNLKTYTPFAILVQVPSFC